MKYGINTVVGGWKRQMSQEELIPWTLARTQIEHKQMREIFAHLIGASPVTIACEFGCGYGRNLFFLREFASHVFGYERDQELAAIAENIWKSHGIEVFNQELFDKQMKLTCSDITLSFTVLQHIVDDSECKKVIDEMQRVTDSNGLILICEETDESLTGSVRGRNRSTYASWFKQCDMIGEWERNIDCGGETSARYLAFKKQDEDYF